MEHPIPTKELSPQLIKLCGPDAPLQVREMAASGLAPVGPVDQTFALYFIAFDKDAKLSTKARRSLEEMPDDVLHSALDQHGDERVLDGLTRLLVRRLPAVEKILLNRHTGGETAAWVASNVRNERILEMVAANEERMLRFPQIIENLYMNRAARMSTVDRAMELAIRHGIELKGIPSFAEIKEALLGDVGSQNDAVPVAADIKPPQAKAAPVAVDKTLAQDEDVSAEDLDFTDLSDLSDLSDDMETEPVRTTSDSSGDANSDDLMFMDVLEADEWMDLDDAIVDDLFEAREDDDGWGGDKETEEKVETVEQMVIRMTPPQKIRMATLGNSAQRSVLVRDSNKLVVMAVIKSPAVTESEIQRYTKFRTIPEEALRYVAKNRDMMKAYQVKMNLVQNPRTPIEDALRFLQFLRANDVKLLEKDKNIPQAIAVAAKRLRAKRGQGG